MARFRQTKLPKRFRKMVKSIYSRDSYHTPQKRRRFIQKTLPECKGWCILITCDICAKEKKVPGRDCCGVKQCFECVYYFTGHCPICDKDYLNQPMFCDICLHRGNLMTVRQCAEGQFDEDGGCDMDVCKVCSRQDPPYDKSHHYCSMRHFFDFLEDVTGST